MRDRVISAKHPYRRGRARQGLPRLRRPAHRRLACAASCCLNQPVTGSSAWRSTCFPGATAARIDWALQPPALMPTQRGLASTELQTT